GELGLLTLGLLGRVVVCVLTGRILILTGVGLLSCVRLLGRVLFGSRLRRVRVCLLWVGLLRTLRLGDLAGEIALFLGKLLGFLGDLAFLGGLLLGVRGGVLRLGVFGGGLFGVLLLGLGGLALFGTERLGELFERIGCLALCGGGVLLGLV